MIIFAHPGIGKTYSAQKNFHPMIDFDSHYKSRVSELLVLTRGITLQRLQEIDKTEYYQIIQQEFISAIERSKMLGVPLFFSDLSLIPQFHDKIELALMLDDETFFTRCEMRNDFHGSDTFAWKNNIDYFVNKFIPDDKVVTFNHFLEDWLKNHYSSQS